MKLKNYDFNFAVKKEISQDLFKWFGEVDIVGCMPLTLSVKFNDITSSLEIIFSMILQKSTLGKMKQITGGFNVDYETIKKYMEQGSAWYVSCEIWELLEKNIKWDIKELVEGKTSISISDEEMEELVRKNRNE